MLHVKFFDASFGNAYRTKGLKLMARRSLPVQHLAYDYSVIRDGSGTFQNMHV